MKWIFIAGNKTLRNAFSGNKFPGYDILGVFDM